MGATGESFETIAKRGGLPRPTVQAIIYRDSGGLPRPATLDKLAVGLNVAPDVVRQAAAASLTEPGPDAAESPTVRVLARLSSQLNEDERTVLIAAARAMLRTHNGHDEH